MVAAPAAASEGVPIATASWPAAVRPSIGAAATSTRLTLYLGDVKPAISSIIEPPAPGIAESKEPVLWCCEMTRNQVTLKTAVYAALTSVSKT